MQTFIAKSGGDRLTFESDYSRNYFANDLRINKGSKYRIERITPESGKLRRFYHGAVIPLLAFFQEGMDHRDHNDCDMMHEWVKIHFNGELVVVNGKTEKIGKSTKSLKQAFVEKVIDYIEDQYGIDRREVLDAEKFKVWHETVFPYGGPDTWIGYLVSINKLEIPYYKQGLRPLTPVL